MTLDDAIKKARDNSIEYGDIWVVWESWSQNEKIRVTTYDTFIEEATAADHAIRCYYIVIEGIKICDHRYFDENGEESRNE